MTCSDAGLPTRLMTAGFDSDITWTDQPLAISSVRLTPQAEPAQYVEPAIAPIATGEVDVPSQHNASARAVLAARVH
ncbi:MAG: hypothetical protein H7123_08255 [Thermoleophilia bacterium]|nr:hypothetical protein [Thermoleophilia bacterium]